MPFFSLSNVDIKFAKPGKLTWRSYITIEALLIINRVKLIDKRDFAKAVLDANLKTFVVYMAAVKAELIYFSQAI